jgi:hypothetical protein
VVLNERTSVGERNFLIASATTSFSVVAPKTEPCVCFASLCLLLGKLRIRDLLRFLLQRKKLDLAW